jgi:hypothetical protein
MNGVSRKPHRLNAPGDFWVDANCCTRCGVPDAEPDLFGIEDVCYVKKQPATPDEVDRMLKVISIAELGCIRYRGRDTMIRRKLVEMGEADVCDPPPTGFQRLWSMIKR